MPLSITKKFDVGDTIYYVLNDELFSDQVTQIAVTVTGATTILYYVESYIYPINENLAFATAEEAVEDLASRVLDAFTP